MRARRYGDQWSTYLALHRHGGVSLGTSVGVYDRPVGGERRQRGFRLCHLVGLTWIVAGVQARVAERLGPEGPWEMTLHLYDTEGAELADFAEAWPAPGSLWRDEVPHAATPQVVVRHEPETWPQERDEIKAFALRVGGNIEDAFGSGHRRFIANCGEL